MKFEWQILIVAVGGALGALSRYGIAQVSQAASRTGFPIGTLLANVAGCFLVGVMMGTGLDEKYQPLRLGLGVGFLGALTTFSTFGGETVKQLQQNEIGMALGNVAANLLLGLLAVGLGILLGKQWQP